MAALFKYNSFNACCVKNILENKKEMVLLTNNQVIVYLEMMLPVLKAMGRVEGKRIIKGKGDSPN